MNKFDHLLIGCFLALLVPFITYMIYLIGVQGIYGPIQGYRYLSEFGIFNSLLKLFVLVNLPLFFIFLNLNMYKTVKGIIMVTLFFALYILYVSIF